MALTHFFLIIKWDSDIWAFHYLEKITIFANGRRQEDQTYNLYLDGNFPLIEVAPTWQKYTYTHTYTP